MPYPNYFNGCSEVTGSSSIRSLVEQLNRSMAEYEIKRAQMFGLEQTYRKERPVIMRDFRSDQDFRDEVARIIYKVKMGLIALPKGVDKIADVIQREVNLAVDLAVEEAIRQEKETV